MQAKVPHAAKDETGVEGNFHVQTEDFFIRLIQFYGKY